jgi:hypothetical protein
MKYLTLLLFVVLMVGCRRAPTGPADTQGLFMTQFKPFCGRAYSGRTIFPANGKDPFAGKQLVLHFKECGRRETRLQFQVGDDLSRTWVLTNTREGLLLKHDHRQPDGTPQDISMYGGFATEEGTGRSQSFTADDHTVQIIPAAKANVWTLEFSPDKESLSYIIKRDGNLRYRADFDLSQPVARQ